MIWNLITFLLTIYRYYINYKMMKKKVKQYVEQTENGRRNHEQVLKEFSRMLDDQVCFSAELLMYSFKP